VRLEREQPLTFLEFNYMILQAYDFLELHRRHRVALQFGGSDQWGNIVNGIELTRKKASSQVFGLTAPLITTSDGKKMGKSASGAVWLNADRLAPYDYWQFWRNTADADVEKFLKLFTELPLEEVARLAALEGAGINSAKVVLADECTRLLHGAALGPDGLDGIKATAASVFAAGSGTGGGDDADLPRFGVRAADVAEGGAGVAVVDLLIGLQMAKSKGEARRLIAGGGARLGGEKVSDEAACLTFAALAGRSEIRVSAGKKRHGVVEVQ
jgi:tyrosyl-tRNA synthetase